MNKVELTSNQPGIIGLLQSFPTTGKILSELAEQLLRSPEYKMHPATREAIASYVSQCNDVSFCEMSHGFASTHLIDTAEITQVESRSRWYKHESLFRLAWAVTKLNRDEIAIRTAIALREGFTNEDIHLTVLIASAFNMYNRYVDGMITDYSSNYKDYIETGKRLAEHGYLPPSEKVENK